MSPQYFSLQADNTFGLKIQARQRIIADTPNTILSAWQNSRRRHQPFLLLGAGSNVLFLNDFAGIVVLNRIKGIKINEQDKAWKLHVGAGENWHMLVEWTLKKGINGLENLALIPGMTGSAPVQNIGAYGMEFKDVCEYVDILNLNTGITQRLDREECAFGYRDSIFKYEPYYAIIAVGINLSKQWQPLLTYGDLARLNPVTVTAFEVFNTICYMRKSKLPETCMTGNVGSFFKNPLVSYEKAEMLKMTYPGIPSYPQVNGKVKLAAGWLIDQCQLKGLRIGGAEVYQKQALVLINVGHATSQDIIELAKTVRFHVGKKFDVWLEPEVRFIGAHGEYNTPIKAIL